MPSFKTHSVHGELLFNDIESNVDLNKEDFKSFCMGPDILILSDYRIFNIQHKAKTRYFYYNLLRFIKENRLEDNSEVLSYLYGSLEHLVLDSTFHPLINNISKDSYDHFMIEHRLDDYVCDKYNVSNVNYYKKDKICDLELKSLIDGVYKKVYNSSHESIKYEIGLKLMRLYDTYIKRFIVNNKYDSSIDDELFSKLWKKSSERFIDTVNDVNRYLYGDGIIRNKYIVDNISYDTGIPCEKIKIKRLIKY